jgi:hypothetical protein
LLKIAASASAHFESAASTVVLSLVVFGLVLVVNGVTSLAARRIRGDEALLGLGIRTLGAAGAGVDPDRHSAGLDGTGRRCCAVDPDMSRVEVDLEAFATLRVRNRVPLREPRSRPGQKQPELPLSGASHYGIVLV